LVDLNLRQSGATPSGDYFISLPLLAACERLKFKFNEFST